jgi:hypothetical protein
VPSIYRLFGEPPLLGPPCSRRGAGRGFAGRALVDDEFNVDVVAGRVGIGAQLMGLGDQRLYLAPWNVRHSDRQRDGQAEAPLLPRSDADRTVASLGIFGPPCEATNFMASRKQAA